MKPEKKRANCHMFQFNFRFSFHSCTNVMIMFCSTALSSYHTVQLSYLPLPHLRHLKLNSHSHMKRSVSPTSDVGPDSQPSKWRLVRVFSAIKDALAGPKPSSPPFAMDANTSRNDIAQNIPTSFVSRKRQNSVIESLRHASQSVPRGSLSVQPFSSGYETVSNSLRTERQAINGNAMLIIEDGSVLIKEVSPSVYVPRNQILPMDPMEMDLDLERASQLPYPEQNEYAPLYCDEEGNLVRPPFINFDPRERYQMLKLKKSYEASEHLRNSMKYMVDPDETISINRPNNKVDCSTQTYNQDYLEKSLNFTALRKKLAMRNRKQRNSTRQRGFFSGSFSYDPVETKAPADQGSKLKGYLGEISLPKFPVNSKEPAVTHKLLPDEDQVPSLKLKSKLSERVGFEDALKAGKAANKPSVAENGGSGNIANLIQVKQTPLPAKRSTTGPSSGFKFDINKSSIAPLLNQKESAPLASSTEDPQASSNKLSLQTNSSSTQPRTTLFSLTTPDEDDDARVKKKSRSAFGITASTSKAAPEANSNFLFGNTASTEKPLFALPAAASTTSKPLFGAKSSEPSNEKSPFGKPKTTTEEEKKKETTPKPAFNLSTEKPVNSFTFGDSTLSEKPQPLTQPTFSFGNKSTELATSSKNTDSPAGGLSFSGFGSKTAESSEKKDSISKNSESVTKPTAFSFGATKNDNNTPLSLFGSATNNVPLFGTKPEDKLKESDAKPSLFGAPSDKDASKAPSLVFTKDSAKASPAPAFSFGQPAKADDKSTKDSTSTPVATEKKESPSFPFGASAPASDKKETPTFLFGNAKPDSIAAPSKPSLFGASADSTKPFSFGGSTGIPTESSDKAKAFGLFGKSTSSPLADGLKPATTLNNTPSTSNLPKAGTTPAFGQSQSSTPQPDASKPSFNFGGNTLADPASIFGGGGGSTPAPAFNFSVGTVNKDLTPAPSFPQPATQKPGGFSFSNKALGGFSGGSNTSLSGGFGGFGAAAQNDSNPMNSAGMGGFGNNSATPSAFGNTSRSVTPNAAPNNNFAFGGNSAQGNMQANSNQFQQSAFGNNSAQAPGFGTPQPGFGTPQPAFGGTPQPAFGATPQPAFGNPTPAASAGGFQFSNNAPGGQAFGSGPGSFGTGSRETTPSGFGGMAGDQSGQGGQGFAAPIANISNRKIAQMRQRKRF